MGEIRTISEKKVVNRLEDNNNGVSDKVEKNHKQIARSILDQLLLILPDDMIYDYSGKYGKQELYAFISSAIQQVGLNKSDISSEVINDILSADELEPKLFGTLSKHVSHMEEFEEALYDLLED